MLTGSYGFYIPENNDTGEVFFPDMVTNLDRLDKHVHNGSSGPKLVKTQAISAAAWIATSGGTYRQVVTLPNTGSTYTKPDGTSGSDSVQLDYDSIIMHFRLSTGEAVYPTVEKLTANTYYVYTNDNTLALVASYIT